MDSLREELESVLRHADPDKLDLKKGKLGMWKVSLSLHLNAADAHHVMEIIDEIEQSPLIPDMAARNGSMERT